MPLALEVDYSDEMARRLIAELGLTPGDVRELQQVPPQQLLRAYYNIYDRAGGDGTMGIVQGFVPVVDGVALPRHPFVPDAPGQSASVPLIIGSTRAELTGYITAAEPKAAADDEGAVRRVPLLGDCADRIFDAYRAAHPGASPWQIRALITADWPTRLYSIDIAEKRSRAGAAPTWMYRIDWEPAVAGGNLMSPHAVEISLVFGTVRSRGHDWRRSTRAGAERQDEGSLACLRPQRRSEPWGCSRVPALRRHLPRNAAVG
jgi:para-nitrobenzyl esterase